MTELDQALQKCLQDENEQNSYYDLVLNTPFYIPTNDDEARSGKTELAENDSVAPIILESESKHYMMLFDSEERLGEWAKEPISYVVLPGHVIAKMSPPSLHWAVNIGTEFSKEFVPEEIAWLKEVVEECEKAENGK